WNQAKECAKGQSRNAEELNRYIESIRVKLYQIHRELEEKGKLITVERIKNIYEGKEENRQTLLQLFAEHNAQCKALIGKGFAPKTVMRFESTYRYVLEFMQGKYHVSDIALNELTPAFVYDFETFLKTVKSCAQNAANTRLKILKKLMRIALENDLIKKSPFVGYKFKYHETNPDFLTMEEIQRIASKKITIRCIEQVRDVFIFQCFTGLAFGDVAQLSCEHLVKGQNGDVWIRKTRQKTKNMCHIPLLPFAIELIEKYREHPVCLKTGKLFPVISNQKMNTYLKEIADICRIEKKMTTHSARHSYATSVCLANGVSMENVAKMLGHASTNVTKHYAKVLDSSIMRDMENVKNVLNSYQVKNQAI
ncbi:MAG: site-specific integrase, partial [Dysgonamonadaceae bacterium]|nr:site-specific integrase [Dysgonamonadaceae bacterium]